jgi:hypothetical protein
VKTLWTIDFACGHTESRNLADRAADARARFASWLATQECTDCWRAARDTDEQGKAAWLEEKRAQEQAETEEWSKRYRMPPLEGSRRAVPWAMRCRHQLLAAAYTALVIEGEAPEPAWEALEDKARTITRAGWWLDQRTSEPEDLAELLDAATDTDRPVENPHS